MIGTMLKLDNITKTYRGGDGEVRAIEGVSLAVAAGEFLAVCGPSGCGKTTLLLAAGALLAPDSGRVEIDGRDPYAMSPNDRAALRAGAVGFIFQQFHLVPYLTVMDNVLAASLAAGGGDLGPRAEQLIERFGLADRARHVPAELSTGERQRTALARALLNKPKLLLADEPTGNLDEKNAEGVLAALGEFAESGGAVLLVTHSRQAADHAQKTVHLASGRLRDEQATI